MARDAIVVLGCGVLGLLWDGGGLDAVRRDPLRLLSFATWKDAFGAAENSTTVLGIAGLVGGAGVKVVDRTAAPDPDALVPVLATMAAVGAGAGSARARAAVDLAVPRSPRISTPPMRGLTALRMSARRIRFWPTMAVKG